MSVKHHKWYVSMISVQSLKTSNQFAYLESIGKYHSTKMTDMRHKKLSEATCTQRYEFAVTRIETKISLLAKKETGTRIMYHLVL